MNKKTTKTLVIGMLFISLLTMTACYQHDERRHLGYGDSEGLPGLIVSKLNLNSGQETQLTEMLVNLEETREELGRRDELRIIFVEQLKNKELDEDYLRQEITEFIREMKSSANEFITDLGSFHASLNEEQKGKLADIISRQKGPKRRHN
jgi:hypothetical protein